MIIVEGPDGSGKDTLINRLMEDFPELKRGPRACDSLLGPRDNLGIWLIDDWKSWSYSLSPRIYNRYPLLSEPIYSEILDRPYAKGFLEVSSKLSGIVATQSLVLMCLPSLEKVRGNVDASRDMPGVVENIDRIYSRYEDLARGGWDGWVVRYNYQSRKDYRSVRFSVMSWMEEWKKWNFFSRMKKGK